MWTKLPKSVSKCPGCGIDIYKSVQNFGLAEISRDEPRGVFFGTHTEYNSHGLVSYFCPRAALETIRYYYDYDEQNRPLRRYQLLNYSTIFESEAAFEYKAQGQLICDADGNIYKYNDKGLVKSINDEKFFWYDEAGNINRIIFIDNWNKPGKQERGTRYLLNYDWFFA